MKILVAVDPNDTAFTRLLKTVARVRREEDSVHVLHVFHVPVRPEPDAKKKGPERIRDEIVAALAGHDLDDAEVEVQLGISNNPGNDIVETASKVEASLIMIATHGRVWRGLFMGSVAERVLRHADCDVYAVRAPRAQ